jgi:hypothetical protein
MDRLHIKVYQITKHRACTIEILVEIRGVYMTLGLPIIWKHRQSKKTISWTLSSKIKLFCFKGIRQSTERGIFESDMPENVIEFIIYKSSCNLVK